MNKKIVYSLAIGTAVLFSFLTIQTNPIYSQGEGDSASSSVSEMASNSTDVKSNSTDAMTNSTDMVSGQVSGANPRF